MDFYSITNLDTDIMEGAFHIMEPIADEKRLIIPNTDLEEATIVLVPGVVFDKKGSRYGYGRGFYDRYFAGKNAILKIGIAYEQQIFQKELKTIATDIKMHRIVTEKEEIKV